MVGPVAASGAGLERPRRRRILARCVRAAASRVASARSCEARRSVTQRRRARVSGCAFTKVKGRCGCKNTAWPEGPSRACCGAAVRAGERRCDAAPVRADRTRASGGLATGARVRQHTRRCGSAAWRMRLTAGALVPTGGEWLLAYAAMIFVGGAAALAAAGRGHIRAHRICIRARRIRHAPRRCAIVPRRFRPPRTGHASERVGFDVCRGDPNRRRPAKTPPHRFRATERSLAIGPGGAHRRRSTGALRRGGGLVPAVHPGSVRALTEATMQRICIAVSALRLPRA